MIVYKITNILNGKIYVGQTIRTLEERWKDHQSSFISNVCNVLKGNRKSTGGYVFVYAEALSV